MEKMWTYRSRIYAKMIKGLKQKESLRVTESFRLEKTFKIIKSNHQSDQKIKCFFLSTVGAYTQRKVYLCLHLDVSLAYNGKEENTIQ